MMKAAKFGFLLHACFSLFANSQLHWNHDTLIKTGGGILWENLTCTAQNGDVILKPSSGFVADGQICGILGPSGSGKSTLMSIIAGRPEASLHVDGKVLHYFNKNKSLHFASVLPDSVAWLQQQDAFFESLTVQETLDLAVFLEWPHLGKAQRTKIAQECLESLGLAKVQSRHIGDRWRSALSGGELRRLSVALELITNPHLFIADEPTTGIDSKMSERVMAVIYSMTKERQIPCFCSLHQPRSSIWHMLDSLILMAPGGCLCYMGSQEDSVPYFSSLGYHCPEETNPAEYLIDLVSIDTESPQQARKDRERIQQLATAFAERSRGESQHSLVKADGIMPSRHELPKVTPLRVMRRISALFRRSWRQSIRSTGLNALRLFMSTFTAVLLSQIFPSVAVKGPPTSKTVTDRICVLTYGVINMFLISLVKACGIFTRETPVIQLEKKRKDYTNLEYMFAKALAEIPMDTIFAVIFTTTLKSVTPGLTIGWRELSSVFALMTVAGASLGFSLGSVTKSEEMVISVTIPMTIICMAVGVINPSGVDPTAATPLLVDWLQAFSPIASAIEGLVVSEFSGQRFVTPSIFDMQRYRDLPRMGGLALVKSGDETLEVLGLKGIRLDSVLSHMWVLSSINFILCWVGMRLSDRGWTKKAGAFVSRQKRRFQKAKGNWKVSLEKSSRDSQLTSSHRPRLNNNAPGFLPSVQKGI